MILAHILLTRYSRFSLSHQHGRETSKKTDGIHLAGYRQAGIILRVGKILLPLKLWENRVVLAPDRTITKGIRLRPPPSEYAPKCLESLSIHSHGVNRDPHPNP